MKSHPAPKRIARIALVALLVAQCGASSFASSHVARQFIASPPQLPFLTGIPVLGDFDGDQRLDQAELHLAGHHRCVRVRFGDSHESHLELIAKPQVHGALLTQDINRDNKPDLIWIYHSQSEPAEVWLGDGLGHFAKAADKSAGARLRALGFGDPNPGLVGDARDEKSLPHTESGIINTDARCQPGR